MSDRTDKIAAALVARGIDIDGTLASSQLKEAIRVAEVAGGGSIHLAEGIAAPGVAASYDTDPDQGANAGLVWTAAHTGTLGNSLKVQYANTATAGSETVTAITAAGVTTIVIGIETTVSTAAQVITAATTLLAGQVMVPTLSAGNSGAGAVSTMAAKALAGGTADFSHKLVVE